ncbi:MAG: alpha/beta hydrolase [Elusimicrobia bacterium]|nr:alpha/beta hydrolase [Elusimicrobiota bacterium]
MTKYELFNWAVFSLFLISAACVVIAYIKSHTIFRPFPKQPLNYTPENFSLAFENIEFSTSDNITLKGWFIPSTGGESSRTIILCHGRGSNKGELLKDTHFLARNGFNLFYFDFRGWGESKGEISSIGYFETRDFDAAHEFVKKHRPDYSEGIGVFGISMGASVAIYAAARNPGIKCMLAENAFYSYERVIANWSWFRLKIPYYPLIPLTLAFVKLRLGDNPDLYSPVHNVDKISQPVFLINGDNDDLVPLEDARRLFKKCSSVQKDLWILTGSPHGKCAEVGGEAYKERVSRFFKENL